MTAEILPFPVAAQPVPPPRLFRKGDSANGIHIIDERDTPRGRELLFAGWGVQAWVAERRLHEGI